MVGLLRVQEWGSPFAQLSVTCSAVKWRTLASFPGPYIPAPIFQTGLGTRLDRAVVQSCKVTVFQQTDSSYVTLLSTNVQYWLQPCKNIILHSTLAIKVHRQFFHSGLRPWMQMNFSDSFLLDVQNLDLKDQLCIRWDRRWVKAEHRIGLTSANVHMHCSAAS